MEGIAHVTPDSTTIDLDSVVFYLHGELNVDSLSLDDQEVKLNQQSVFYSSDYSLVANRVSFAVSRNGPCRFTTYYQGFFSPSRCRSQSDYMRIDDDGVFLRSFGYSLWFPILLEPDEDSYAVDFADVRLRTPVEFTPVFAGERVSEEVAEGWRISRWHADHLDVFAAQCTAQKSSVMSEGNVFLYHYEDSVSTAMARNISSFVRRLNGRFTELYRTNVFSGQYHIMEMPAYGDISSANVTGITSGIWLTFESDERSKRALAHEMVHPFVETNTPKSDSLFALAVEGFPSYFHLPVLAEEFGQAWYEKKMERTEASYLHKKQTGLGWRDYPVPEEKPLTGITASEVGIYKDVFVLDDRALLFLHWLYRQMGRDRFLAFAHELFNTGPVTLDSFRALILRYLAAASADLRTWLETTEFPESFHVARN
ncbi:MAG TPA: hypothetical protein VN285_01670 [Candidatus Deferrimicrobium sp.]|nr:hypothetical protein [Candidatus Deferrimicrobium sp.]